MTEAEKQSAWNEALERVTRFLDGFALGDRTHVSRLALALVDEARTVYDADSSRHPTATTLGLAEKRLTDWLATNLDEPGQAPSKILANGSIALLLSRVFQTAPNSFLSAPLPEELRQALREKLLVAGPDLNISRMTPRHLDYGPMLGLARQTWHRWDVKVIFAAIVFWTCIYGLSYWLLSTYFL